MLKKMPVRHFQLHQHVLNCRAHYVQLPLILPSMYFILLLLQRFFKIVFNLLVQISEWVVNKENSISWPRKGSGREFNQNPRLRFRNTLTCSAANILGPHLPQTHWHPRSPHWYDLGAKSPWQPVACAATFNISGWGCTHSKSTHLHIDLCTNQITSWKHFA